MISAHDIRERNTLRPQLYGILWMNDLFGAIQELSNSLIFYSVASGAS